MGQIARSIERISRLKSDYYAFDVT